MACATGFADDPQGVPDDAFVYRRVDWDRIGGRAACPPGEVARLSGNAFADYPDERARAMGYPGACMSVGIALVLQARGLGSEQMIENYEGYGVARIRVGDLRRLTRSTGEPCPQGVMAWPTSSEPWHGIVFEPGGGARKRAVKDAIARIAAWEIPLVNV